MDYINTGSEPL